MKSWIQTAVHTMSLILLAAILLFAGCLWGMKNERTRLKQYEQAEVVTEVAIVNLDEGVYENGKKVFYSTELMDLEADYLVAENLEAARQGILNGSYAAYILIPAEFSQNAISINFVPEKAVLEFAMNPNLREDVSRLTMSNVKNFEISLNTNMSYMYVQALLSEFHTAQDMSGTILENDNTETERLQEIDAETLLVEPEYEEIDAVETEIEEVDFNETFDQNDTILDALYSNYQSFVQEGETAFEAIKEKELVIEEGMGSFYESISGVDIQTDEEGNIVYEDGVTAMNEYLQGYSTQFDTQLVRIKTMINIISGDSSDTGSEGGTDTGTGTETESGMDNGADTGTGTGADIGMGAGTETEGGENIPPTGGDNIFGEDIKPVTEIIRDNINLTLESANQKIQECNTANAGKIANAKTYITELEQLLTDQAADEELMNKVAVLKGEIEGLQEVPAIILENTFDETVALEPFTKLKQEVDALTKIETKECQSILDEKIVQPLVDEVTAENENMKTAGESIMTPLEEYMTELGELDLYEYYDEEAMDALLEEFGDNIFTMEEDVVETHGEYQDLMNDTIDHANDSMETHQQNLEEAYESTTQNVSNEVNLAIENREKMNEVNSGILVSFKEKLPYTRIGQLEYVQAYDFMVKPLKMSDASISVDKTVVWHEYSFWRNVLIIMVIGWGVCNIVLIYLKVKVYAETDRNGE